MKRFEKRSASVPRRIVKQIRTSATLRKNAGDLRTRKNARQIAGAITTSIKTTRNGKLKGANVKRDTTKLIKTTLLTLKRKSSKSASIESGRERNKLCYNGNASGCGIRENLQGVVLAS